MNALLKIFFYKVIYGCHVNISVKSTFRKSFQLIVAGKGKINISSGVFFNNYCSISVIDSEVTVKENTYFGESVKIYDHNHRFRNKNRPIKEQGFSCESVTIGHDCWIGSNVVILKGVNIGNNVVVGAGCVIYRDIPDNKIVKNNQNLIFEDY